MKHLSFNAYTLKWIAIIGMITSHIATAWHLILPTWLFLPLFTLGGFTYVIMAFFVVEGYKYTSSLRNYIGRLLVFGFIAQSLHNMVIGVTQIMPGIFLNIMFTITLSLIVLRIYDKIKYRALFWIFIFPIAIVASLYMDLAFIGVIVPLMYFRIKKESRRRTVPGVVAGIIWIILGGVNLLGIFHAKSVYGAEAVQELIYGDMGMSMNFLWGLPLFGIGCIFAAILIRNYNGERGKPAKWLFYVVYPVHFAVIAAISLAFGWLEPSLFGIAI